MKEEILAFLEWAQKERHSELFYDMGKDDPLPYYNIFEWEDLIEDFIKSQEAK